MNNISIISSRFWLNTGEVSSITGVACRTVRWRAKEGRYTISRISDGRLEINLSSLPYDIQARYLDEKGLLPEKHESEKLSVPGYTNRQLEVAQAKLDLVMEWRQFRTESKLSARESDEIFIARYKAGKYPLIFKALNGKGSVKTIYRDYKTLRDNGFDYKSLVPGYKTGNDEPGLSDEEKFLLEMFIKTPTALKISEIIRKTKKELVLRGLKANKCDRTYQRWIEYWKSKNYDQWVLFREGSKSLNDKVSYHVTRDKRKLRLGDMMIIDGHVLNFQIASPATGKPQRMILIVVYDYATDMPLGWEIMPTENRYSIASAVRRAQLFLGKSLGYPGYCFKGRIVNIDNGRANKSKMMLGEKQKWFNDEDEFNHSKGLLRSLFESVLVSKAYHGQAKTVERFFGTFAEMERGVISYSGTSIEKKVPRLMRNEKLHKSVYTALTGGQAISIFDAHLLIADWFDEYSRRERVSGEQKGIRPSDLFTEDLEYLKSLSDFASRLISDTEVKYLMLEETCRTLYRDGIHIFGRKYFAHEFYPLQKGKDKVNFKIKYDLDKPDSILVYDKKTGKFICEAFAKDKVHPAARILGTAEELEELNSQLQLQGKLIKTTETKFKEHFKEVVEPEIPDTIKAANRKKVNKTKNRDRNIHLIKNDEPDLDIPTGNLPGYSDYDDLDLDINDDLNWNTIAG